MSTYYTIDQCTLRSIYNCAKHIQILPTPYTGDDLQMAKAAVAQAKRIAQTIIDLIPKTALPDELPRHLKKDFGCSVPGSDD